MGVYAHDVGISLQLSVSPHPFSSSSSTLGAKRKSWPTRRKTWYGFCINIIHVSSHSLFVPEPEETQRPEWDIHGGELDSHGGSESPREGSDHGEVERLRREMEEMDMRIRELETECAESECPPPDYSTLQ